MSEEEICNKFATNCIKFINVMRQQLGTSSFSLNKIAAGLDIQLERESEIGITEVNRSITKICCCRFLDIKDFIIDRDVAAIKARGGDVAYLIRDILEIGNKIPTKDGRELHVKNLWMWIDNLLKLCISYDKCEK